LTVDNTLSTPCLVPALVGPQKRKPLDAAFFVNIRLASPSSASLGRQDDWCYAICFSYP